MLGVVGLSTAHAATSNNFYVAPAGDGGNDAGNNCTLQAKPCATIEHAIVEEGIVTPGAVGSVINLSSGTFDSTSDTMFAGLTASNDNVTITGAVPKIKKNGKVGKLKPTIVAPQLCTSLGTVDEGIDSGQQAMVVFDAPTGTTAGSIEGVTVENIVLDGAGVAGGTCGSESTGYSAGVIDTDGQENSVVGDTIESGTTYGILTDDGGSTSIISNILTPVLCTTTVTGPNTGLNAGWTTPENLKVKAFPKCAQFIESGHGAATGVFINGVGYCVTTSATKNTLVITGTPTPADPCATTGGAPIEESGGLEVATGSTVIYNTSVAPFTQYGIACDSPVESADNAASEATDCAISDNTVTGGGTAYTDLVPTGTSTPLPPCTGQGSPCETPSGQVCNGLPPVGIVATNGATANIDGNSVSDVADTINGCPEEGESTSDGIGIGLIPDPTNGCSAGNSEVGVNDLTDPTTGAGNTLAGNDVGIKVKGNTEPGPCTSGLPSYEVNNNTVSSGDTIGIDLENLGVTSTATTGAGNLDSPLASNTISGVTTGAGIEALGITEQTIGGDLASEGDSVTGSGIGLVFGPCVYFPSENEYCENFNSGFEPSQDNLVQNNTFTGNIAYGVMDVGSFQVDELATQIPYAVASLLASSDNTFNANNWGTATSASNGTLPSEIDGAEVMDGTGWGGGCASEAGDCPVLTNPLIYEGPNTTFSSSYPGTATITLSVCNNNSSSEILPRGTEITFNEPNVLFSTAGEPDDGGTFFVTQDAIITGNAGCTGAFYNLMVQAIAPAEVGTLNSPSGQPYILGTGDEIFVNANSAGPGPGAVTAKNFYGTGAASNSCTPADVTQTAGNATGTSPFPHGAVTTPDVFGTTDPPSTPGFLYSTTLQASTGGVNATYAAC
jgi:hypothetical protein